MMKRISNNFDVTECVMFLREAGENVSKRDVKEVRIYERELGEDEIEVEDLNIKSFREIDYEEGETLKVMDIRLVTGKIYHVFHDDYYIYAANRLEMFRPEKFIVPFN